MCSDCTGDCQPVCGIGSLVLIFAVSMIASATAQTVAARMPPKQSIAIMERSSLETSPLFGLTATYPSGGREVAAISAADVNGDGIPDLLVANAYYYNTIGVMLANGYGAYLPVVTYGSGGGFPVSIVPIDVNGDGKIDLVVLNQTPCYACTGDGLVAVLLGNGDGTFQSAKTYDSGGVGPAAGDLGPNPMAVVDMNGDGKLDVVVANCAPKGSTGCGDGGGRVGVLLGNGDGTFQPVITYGTGFSLGGTGLAVGDLNGDGKLDLIVTGSCGSCQQGHIAVLLGDGHGAFKRSVQYALLGANATGIAVGDLNSDGRLDVVVGGCSSSDCFTSHGLVTVMLGNGDGTFGTPRGYDSGGRLADGLALADVNGDGSLDILVANTIDTSLGVIEGKGDGTFLSPLVFGPTQGYLYSVAVTDVNRDGNPDVIVGGTYGDKNNDFVDVFINSPTSIYQATTTTLSSSLNPSAFGQSVTFTARVTPAPPDGEPIIFSQGKKRLASVPSTGGTAVYTTSSLTVGTHYITATYFGDTYLKISKKTIKQVVE